MPTTQRRTVAFVGIATAFSLLGDQVLYAVLPVLHDDLGLAAIEVGILLSANRWIRLVTNTLAMRVATIAPNRMLLGAALVLGALTTAGYYFTNSFAVLLAARLLWGLSWSFIRHVGVDAVMRDAPEHQAGQTMGWYNGISRAGSVAGLFGGAVLVDLLGFHAAVLMLAALQLGASPLAGFAIAGHAKPKATRGAPIPWAMLVVGAALGSVGPGLVMSTLGAGLELRLEPGATFTAVSLTGALLAVRYLCDTALAPILGGSFDRYGFARATSIYLSLGGLLLVAATAFGGVWLYGIAVIGFFVCGTALQAGVAARASQLGGGAFARYVTASDFGSAAGPLIGWTVVGFTQEPDTAFWIGSAVFLATAATARLHLSEAPAGESRRTH